MSIAAKVSQSTKDTDALSEAFPSVSCGHQPKGQYIIVQLRLSKGMTAGGIILTDYDKDTEKDNTQVCRIVAIGSGAYRDRRTGEIWPEGEWFKVGDFARCPKYGGDRWSVPCEHKVPERKVGSIVYPSRTENVSVEFAMFRELDVKAECDDPLRTKVFY